MHPEKIDEAEKIEKIEKIGKIEKPEKPEPMAPFIPPPIAPPAISGDLRATAVVIEVSQSQT
jgi:hypothetical protein